MYVPTRGGRGYHRTMKKKLLLAGTAAAVLCLCLAVLFYYSLRGTLPDVTLLKRYRPPAASEVFDRKGRLLTQYYDRALRFWLPVTEVPDVVIRSVVIAEDDTFFEHKGINYKSTWDALVHDVKKLRFSRGGSTITQQMIKNVFLSKEKTINRKVREYLLARQAERILTKRQILEIYLNEVEWGENVYGIEAASRYYFDKHVGELTLGESALLAGMLPNPRYYNPFKRPDKAMERQERVLSNMLLSKVITEDMFTSAVSEPVRLRQESSDRFDLSSPGGKRDKSCYRRVLEEVLLTAYGEQGLYRQGMKIRTTLDKDMQETFRSEEDEPENGGAGIPDDLTLVKDGDETRAIACTSDPDTVRAQLAFPGVPSPGLSVEIIPSAFLRAADFVVEPAIDPGAVQPANP